MQTRSTQDAQGMDVSHWQGTIDWNAVKQFGIVFAFIKATEATRYVDPDFHTNFSKAKEVGIYRGAYHFARPGSSSGEAQAQYFLSVLSQQADFGELPPVLDLEDNGGLTPQELSAWVNAWAAKVATVVSKTPILYVSPYFANTYLDSSLTTLTLWVANWDVVRPQDMSQWQDWVFWQYTSKGSVNGIVGDVDLDVYAGTAEALRSRFAATPPTDTSPHPGTETHSPPQLVQGDTGLEVTKLQMILYQAHLHPGPIDGIFGPETLAAVRNFQQQHHIAVDGIVGPVTWSFLTHQSIVPRPTLARGASGQEVKDLQYLLNYWGMRPGAVDGIFGPNTLGAVRRFQARVRIAQDGIVGPITWRHLLASLPAK